MLPNWPCHVPATTRTLFLQVSFLARVQRSQHGNNSQTVDLRAAVCQWSTIDEHPVQGLQASRSFPTLQGSVEQWDRWGEIPAGEEGSLLAPVFSFGGRLWATVFFARHKVLVPDWGEASSSSPGLPFPSLRPASPCPAGSAGVPREKHLLKPRHLALDPRRRGSGRPRGETRGYGRPGRSPRAAPGGSSAASGWSQRAALARVAAACALRSLTGGGDIAGQGRNSPFLHPPPSPSPSASSFGDTAKRQRRAAASPSASRGAARLGPGLGVALLPGSRQRHPRSLSYPREAARQPESGAWGKQRGRAARRWTLWDAARPAPCRRGVAAFADSCLCKSCCCRWTQPSTDMELLPPPPLLLEWVSVTGRASRLHGWMCLALWRLGSSPGRCLLLLLRDARVRTLSLPGGDEEEVGGCSACGAAAQRWTSLAAGRRSQGGGRELDARCPWHLPEPPRWLCRDGSSPSSFLRDNECVPRRRSSRRYGRSWARAVAAL